MAWGCVCNPPPEFVKKEGGCDTELGVIFLGLILANKLIGRLCMEPSKLKPGSKVSD